MAGLRCRFDLKDKDRGYKKLVQTVFGGKRAEIAVGILQAAGGQQHEGGGGSVLDVATTHELGLGNVPKRSFLVDYFEENQGRMVQQAKALMRSVVTGKRNQRDVLELLGQRWAGEIQQRIAQGIPPGLAESTKAAKRRRFGKNSDTPLIATGQLRASISYRVKGYFGQAIGNAVATAVQKAAPNLKKAQKALKARAKRVKQNVKKISKRATREKKALVKKARAKIAKVQKTFQKKAKAYQKKAAKVVKKTRKALL